MMTKDQIQELINNSIKGNTNSFTDLVVEFQPLVFRLAFRLLCNNEDAKDVVQDVFIKVWTNLQRYDNQYSFSTWLYKIAGNLCCDRLRSKKRVREIDLPVYPVESVESAMINKELKELIINFTSDLTPKQKLVFMLRDIEELDTEEIMAITGLTAEKIKSNLYLARKRIKEKLNDI